MGVLTEHVTDWRDETSSARYPFEDRAVLRSADGRIDVPNELIVDANLYPTFNPVGLSKVTVSAAGAVTLTFAADTGSAVATCLLPPGQTIADVYEADRVAGVLVLADGWEQYAAWQPGEYRFNHRRARLVPAAVTAPAPVGLEGLTDGLVTAAGELWLIGENGVVVRPVSDTEVRIDVVGDPLFRRRRCEPVDAFVTPGFVKTINGQVANDYGGFLVRAESGRSVLRIFPDGLGVRIEVVGTKGSS